MTSTSFSISWSFMIIIIFSTTSISFKSYSISFSIMFSVSNIIIISSSITTSSTSHTTRESPTKRSSWSPRLFHFNFDLSVIKLLAVRFQSVLDVFIVLEFYISISFRFRIVGITFDINLEISFKIRTII